MNSAERIMYLREVLIENSGPISRFDLALPFNVDGTPKPLIVVGQNGSGKSIFLSYVVDALFEFAVQAFGDVVLPHKQASSRPYFRLLSGTTQRVGEPYGLAFLAFSGDGPQVHSYYQKTGSLTMADIQ